MPLLIAAVILSADYGEAGRKTAVHGLRYSSNKSHTRVVVDLKGPVEYTQNRLPNPDRIFFDLKNCSITPKTRSSLNIRNEIIQTVRIAQFDAKNVRVVFDLKRFGNYYAFMLENPHRLVIDVYAPKNHVRSQERNEIITLQEKTFNTIKTVVIDPGHGGKDPGAVGPRGLREKDIVLSVGKKLGNILKKRHGLKVIYTRDRDVFVPLNDRTEIANSKKADLFISIHVNASERRQARGIETYFLNWTNNKEAMRVAARENKISIKKMQKMQDDLQMIFQDLARDNKREESVRLARSVQSSMVNTLKKRYSRIEDLGIKYAMFYVLVGAEMPSVLIEISFISNREEEKRLSGDSYRKMIAEAIAKGIDSYISKATLIVKPVKPEELGPFSNDMKKSSAHIQPQG